MSVTGVNVADFFAPEPASAQYATAPSAIMQTDSRCWILIFMVRLPSCFMFD